MDAYEQWKDWLASKWRGDFLHQYQLPAKIDRHWKGYREAFGSDRWCCKHLEQARDRYWWAGQGYAENESKLESLSKELVQALSGDVRGTYEACIKILKWGDVGKQAEVPSSNEAPEKRKDPTRRWLERERDARTLCSSLQEAVSVLKMADERQVADQFERGGWPMNSATTKIFARADPTGGTVIYDGRVGAALCMLVRRSAGADELEKDARLKFFWGADRKHVKGARNLRDPRGGGFRFGNLARAKGGKRAGLVVRTSNLLREMSERSGASPRDWEAALFMIGYQVRDQVTN